VFITFDLMDKYNLPSSSGLKVDYEKTKAFYICSSINRSPLAGRDEITWETSKVFALGVWFSTNRADRLPLNYQERIDKINKVIEN